MQSEHLQRLRFFETALHPCNYLETETARTVVADPAHPTDKSLYTRLAMYGFRRSGNYIYRPACPSCNRCVAVRIPVDEFSPKRSQRRVWKRNADLNCRVTDGVFHEEHFELYQRYQHHRHGDGDMASHDEDDYRSFLFPRWGETILLELRQVELLIAVAVIDVTHDGLSSVYTFFDPAEDRRSLGVYAILKSIELTRERALPWLYLGYWIDGCRKMQYKEEYLPQYRYANGRWNPWRPRES